MPPSRGTSSAALKSARIHSLYRARIIANVSFLRRVATGVHREARQVYSRRDPGVQLWGFPQNPRSRGATALGSTYPAPRPGGLVQGEHGRTGDRPLPYCPCHPRNAADSRQRQSTLVQRGSKEVFLRDGADLGAFGFEVTRDLVGTIRPFSGLHPALDEPQPCAQAWKAWITAQLGHSSLKQQRRAVSVRAQMRRIDEARTVDATRLVDVRPQFASPGRASGRRPPSPAGRHRPAAGSKPGKPYPARAPPDPRRQALPPPLIRRPSSRAPPDSLTLAPGCPVGKSALSRRDFRECSPSSGYTSRCIDVRHPNRTRVVSAQ